MILYIFFIGEAPVVVARGGFSGIFPESSQYAYQIAQSTSLKNLVLLCDLQLTKDGGGICQSDLSLDNSTTISSVFPKGQKTYSVNGQPLTGWFSVDFTSDQIYNNVSCEYTSFCSFSGFCSVYLTGSSDKEEIYNNFWLIFMWL